MSTACNQQRWPREVLRPPEPAELIIVRAIIKDPVCVKEEVEIVEVDDRLLLGHSAETIFVDE